MVVEEEFSGYSFCCWVVSTYTENFLLFCSFISHFFYFGVLRFSFGDREGYVYV